MVMDEEDFGFDCIADPKEREKSIKKYRESLKPKGTQIVILSFENRELMDKTLDRWKKFRRELNKQQPKHAENAMEDVYGFAYWLFRYSGLKVSE